MRGGHVIPQIRLTPPDSRPAKAPEVPEQDLGPNKLFVPLRTEEVGWEEGGLIWAPKRYYYPTVSLYGGADDRVIGTYRGGPEGYRFIRVTDPAFSLANKEDDKVSEKSTKKSSTNGSRSTMPRGPATTSIKEEQPLDTPARLRTPSPEHSRAQRAVEPESPVSTASSSRQCSFSTDHDSSGADTGATTPAEEETTSSGKQDDAMPEKLHAALQDLQEQSHELTGEDRDITCKLATRAGAVEIPTERVEMSKLGGPFKSQLQSTGPGTDKSLTLVDELPPSRFHSYAGRAVSKPTGVRPTQHLSTQFSCEYAAGWIYEQNMQTQYRNEEL